MGSKNYYQILNVAPTASLNEIKKAYRQLALQHHPDTTSGDTFSVEKFIEIKEAYEVLGDTKKRQAYHYKNFYKPQPFNILITPEIILEQTANLAGFVAVLDPYRIDYDKLNYQILKILNANACMVLKDNNKGIITKKIIENILKTTLFLSYEMAVSIHQILLNLTDNNNAITSQINKQTQQQKQLFYWHKYKLLGTLFLAIILCVCFYLSV